LTRVIVDASVAVKWFIPDIHAEAAARVLDREYQRIAPELAAFECIDALRKRTRRAGIQPVDAKRMAEELNGLVAFRSTIDLTPIAFDLAIAYGKRVYDAIYVALAVREDCPLVTADRPLYDAVKPSLPDHVLWIEDLPQLP
jgi:predicted nucleic acid-binding protein